MRTLALFCGLWLIASAAGAQTVADRIDQLIDAAAGGPVNPVIDDAAYCRRVSLDAIGRIPTSQELAGFLAETAPEKRHALAERLLQSPAGIAHQRNVWHRVLMERMGENDEWNRFLTTSFEQNLPWDTLVRTILNPPTDVEAQRGAAFFLTKRLENYGQQPVDLPALTRDVGRFFLGVDLQCAQCHDHLFVDDYKQLDFQGLHSFLAHTFIRQDVKFPAVGEKVLAKRTEFQSVFIKEPKETGPRIPFGAEVEVVVFAKGEEFSQPPDKQTKFPGRPKFSPLQELAQRLPVAENPYFVKNAVNRVWAQLMGRGLVHPLDLQHAGNPPSHPEVLDLLAAEFVAHQFDLRWLTLELMKTRTYQRSSVLPADGSSGAEDRYRVAIERPLSPEQLAASAWTATGHTDAPPADVLKKFVAAFANPPREPEGDFAPSVKGALFLSHDATVLSWLQPTKGLLVDQVQSESDTPRAIEQVYAAVLSRRPTADETATLTRFLESVSDRPQALGQAAWALLTSIEFCVSP